jgi:predicted lipoprotein with Yx(FWY)xxD motif
MRAAQRRRLGWSALVMAGALALAACGDDGGSTAVTGAASTGATGASTSSAAVGGGYDYGGGAGTTTAPAPTTAPAATSAGTVKVSKTGLGDVLTDDKGRTLYVFLRDEKGKSNCTAACLNTWPRYTPAAVSAGSGVDATKLGTISVDGAAQATIDGLPLYYYASDTAAGDTKGQGVGGNWYVVDPTGAVK